MGLDHEAIYKAYAGTVVSIDDGAGAFDKDGKSVSLDQSKIAAARTTRNDEAAAAVEDAAAHISGEVAAEMDAESPAEE